MQTRNVQVLPVANFESTPPRPPTRHSHTDTPTSVGTGSSHCHDLMNLANCNCAIIEMADLGSKISGSSATATTIDRGKRDDGNDASNERELGSTGGGGMGEGVEVRSCGGRLYGNEEGVVTSCTASSLHFSCQPSRSCCCACFAAIFKNDRVLVPGTGMHSYAADPQQ